jgi:hypothetical protein
MAKKQKVETVSVRFVRAAQPKDGSGRIFNAGEIHELRDDSAEHWIRRGYAVIDSGEPVEQESVADNDADPEGAGDADDASVGLDESQ